MGRVFSVILIFLHVPFIGVTYLFHGVSLIKLLRVRRLTFSPERHRLWLKLYWVYEITSYAPPAIKEKIIKEMLDSGLSVKELFRILSDEVGPAVNKYIYYGFGPAFVPGFYLGVDENELLKRIQTQQESLAFLFLKIFPPLNWFHRHMTTWLIMARWSEIVFLYKEEKGATPQYLHSTVSDGPR